MNSNPAFSKLLEPGYVGKVKTRNRMVRSGASVIFLDEHDFVKEESLRFYEALARGGVGMIVLGGVIVDHHSGTCHPGQMLFSDDKYMPGYEKIAEVVHKHNCPVFVQIYHGGALHGLYNMMTGDSVQPVSSSSLSRKELEDRETDFGMTVRGLTIDEVKAMVNTYADAAVRTQKAGFDGIEVNVATHHLGNSFLSRIWNKRHDEYGADSLENRARLLWKLSGRLKNASGMTTRWAY